MIGQTVSHYRILSKLGEGGMGAVYVARILSPAFAGSKLLMIYMRPGFMLAPAPQA